MKYRVLFNENESLLVDKVKEVIVMEDNQVIFYGENQTILAVVNGNQYQAFYKEDDYKEDLHAKK